MITEQQKIDMHKYEVKQRLLGKELLEFVSSIGLPYGSRHKIIGARISENIQGSQKDMLIPYFVQGLRQDFIGNCIIENLRFEKGSLLEYIDSQAFDNIEHKYIKTVDISNCDMLKEIRSYTFQLMNLLEEVKLNKKIEKIGTCAFCETNINKIEIDSKISLIDCSAFCNCKRIKTVNIKSTEKLVIAREAFEGCHNIKSIIIEAPSLIIKEGAFRLIDLDEIKITSRHKEIHKNAFINCKVKGK